MPESAVHVEGLDAFREALGEAASGSRWTHEFQTANSDVAHHVTSAAREFAVGTGRMQAHFANLISPRWTDREAAVGVSRKANAAFWGAKKHTGWYAKPQYWSGPPQFPEWVGNNWDIRPGQGPLAIVPAIVHEFRWIEERYLKVVDGASHDAFPEGA